MTWATHLSDWQVRERLGSPQHLGRAEREQELLRALETAHANRARADALEDVRVGSGALEQAVLAREAQRLVVERVAEEAGVEDLEHVDLGEVAVEGGGIRDRVQAVEGMGEVDEAALLADGRDRVREGHPARDLLLEEEADHLALAVRLHLFARDHDEVSAAGELDPLERAAERVVVGDRDSAQADLLRVVEQLCGRRRAIVRPVRVHVQVDDDPVAAFERVLVCVGSAMRLAREAGVHGVELPGDVVEALSVWACARPSSARRVRAASSAARSATRVATSGPASTTAAPAVAASRRRRSSPSIAGTKIEATPSAAARCSGRRTERTWTRLRTSRGIGGRKPSGFVCRSVSSQSGSSRRSRVRARVVLLPPGSSSSAIVRCFVAGRKSELSTPSGISA